MKKLHYLVAFCLPMLACQPEPDYLQIISPAQLNQTMQSGDIFLVDVHTPEQKHIKGTDLFAPFNEIEKYQSKLPQDKNQPIYLYCKSGRMAVTAAKTLHELGYTHLSNLEGGIEAWKQAGLGVE